MVVVQAFDERGARHARLAVDFEPQRVLRVEELRVLAVRPGHAGDRHHERLEVPVERQWQFRDHLRFDDPAGVGAVRLQQRRFRRHGDRFRHLADFEGQVDTHRRVDVHPDVLAHDLLEALEFGRDVVGAVLQAREDVVAKLVGHRGAADVRLHLGGGNGGAGNSAAARVGDVPQQRAGHGLRARGRGRQGKGQRGHGEHQKGGNGRRSADPRTSEHL